MNMLNFQSVSEIQSYIKMVRQSPSFASISEPEMFVRIMKGQEIGVPPMQAILELSFSASGKGGPKLTMSSSLMVGLAKRAGYRIEIAQSDDTACVIKWYDKSDNYLGDTSFTIEDAKKAGLAGKGIWLSYTKDMLQWRAVSRGVRLFAAEALGSVYLPGELGDDGFVDDSGNLMPIAEVEETKMMTPDQARRIDLLGIQIWSGAFWAKADEQGELMDTGYAHDVLQSVLGKDYHQPMLKDMGLTYDEAERVIRALTARKGKADKAEVETEPAHV